MELAARDSRPIVLQRGRARRGQTGTLRWALPIDGTRPRHYCIPRSGLVQKHLLNLAERKYERLRRSREPPNPSCEILSRWGYLRSSQDDTLET